VRAAALACVVLVLGGNVALAGNEPQLASTFPRHERTARSQDAVEIKATYDRDLNDHHSTLKLRDKDGVVVPGVSFLSGPTSIDGGQRTISFRATSPLSEAASPYTARAHVYAQSLTGDTVTTWTFVIDDTPPAPPVVTEPSDGEIFRGRPVVVRGMSEPGALILIIENAVTIATDDVNANGDFAVTLPYPPEDGVSHTFEVFARDPAGNTSNPTGPITVWHDAVVVVPAILTPPQDAYLNNPVVVVSGTAKAGTTVRVHEGAAIVGTTSAANDGGWGTTITFAEGTHTITATSFDGVTTDGPSDARTFTVDLTAPAAPLIIEPAPGAFLNSTQLRVRGTAEPRGSVRIRDAGLVRTTVAVDEAGGWSALVSFSDGPHTISAEVLDRAGNVGPAAFRTFTVDTAAPPPPVITQPAQHAFVSTSTVTIAGTAEPGSIIELVRGTVVVATTTTGGTGSWLVAVTLADGAHSFVAVAIDAAGNRSAGSDPRSFTVDTVAPAAPVIVEPGEGETVTSNSVEIAGTAEDAAAITVTEGLTTIGTTFSDGEGNWSVTVAMSNGPHAVRATATDAAGNVSPPSALRSFSVAASIDVTPPAAPVLTDPPEGSLQPAFVMFRGTAEAGSTVKIYRGAGVIAHGTATAGTFELGAQMLSGAQAVTATATDAAGNQSAHTPLRSFTVDAQRPTVTIDTPDNTIYLPFATPHVTGTANDGTGVAGIELELRSLMDGPPTIILATCSGCPETAATWAADLGVPPGSYRLEARAIDTAGNRSEPASIRIYVL